VTPVLCDSRSTGLAEASYRKTGLTEVGYKKTKQPSLVSVYADDAEMVRG
jgi:hypothetical protein